MDEMANSPEPAGGGTAGQRSKEALLTENRMLRGATVVLKSRLREQQSEVAKERALQLMLREANQHLVLATFGAEDQKAAAETANEHQAVFLSMLAHELRNPIASIAVANNVLLGVELSHPLAEKMIAIVGRQTRHLQRLVDDLLDVARINTGKISLNTTLLSLHDVIGSAMETIQPSLTQRQQGTVLTLPAAPLLFIGDMVRLSQLFSNLMINASKFSKPNSTIFITATVDDGLLSVAIKDPGHGIAPEDQLRIFDMFAQGPDAPGHAAAGGLGIGLALVKAIAHMHGGSVRVYSAGIDCGSEFIVVLPLPPAAADDAV